MNASTAPRAAAQPMSLAVWGQLLLLGLLWGGSFFFARIAVAEMPPLVLVFWRVLIAAAALHLWLRARGVKGIDASRGPRFNQAILVIEAAAAGRGVALAKKAIAEADLASGRLVAPFADGSTSIEFGYWLVWPKGRHLSQDVRDFMKWIKAEAAQTEVVGV